MGNFGEKPSVPKASFVRDYCQPLPLLFCKHGLLRETQPPQASHPSPSQPPTPHENHEREWFALPTTTTTTHPPARLKLKFIFFPISALRLCSSCTRYLFSFRRSWFFKLSVWLAYSHHINNAVQFRLLKLYQVKEREKNNTGINMKERKKKHS